MEAIKRSASYIAPLNKLVKRMMMANRGIQQLLPQAHALVVYCCYFGPIILRMESECQSG